MNVHSSWAAFDEQVQTTNNDIMSSSFTTQEHNGVDSLYISKTSENVAPATVALLRQSGLTTSSSSARNTSNNSNDGHLDAEANEEEFRLRFHWMRPHPSIVFSIEEEMAMSMKKKQEVSQSIQTNRHDDMQNGLPENRQQQKPTPAVTTAKMMQVYRDAQIEQHETLMEEEEGGDEVIPLEGEANFSQSDNMKAEGKNNSFVKSSAEVLPFEHPELRVDLSSLVEPPLMTSWLPSAESIDTAYRDD